MTRPQKEAGSPTMHCLLSSKATSRHPRSSGTWLVLAVIAVSALLSIIPGFAQTYDAPADGRKVISRVDPEYPDALKRLYIGGIVRVEVVVSANGTVKETKLLGGNPILGQSTMKAIQRWKYAPAGTEQTLTVKVEFDPHR